MRSGKSLVVAVAISLCAVLFFVSGAATGAQQAEQFITLPYTPPKIVAKVKPYTVAKNLSNVQNKKLVSKMTTDQKAALVKNGFVGSPTQDQQLFFIYENNAYKNIPSFITTDSVLQAYHIFYDFTLREVETKYLDKELRKMTAALLEANKGLLRKYKSPGLLHEAALRNAAYFGVAGRLLGMKPALPAEAKKMVALELQKIDAHAARSISSIFPYMIEYTQFVPRGHYTRSETLKKYFKAMMWYGLVPFALEWPEEKPAKPARLQTLQALLISKTLNDTGMLKSWDAIYSPTAFYVGSADDLTPHEYLRLTKEIFGAKATPEELAKPELLDRFIARAKVLRPPKIETYMIGVPNGPQFRLMGQRFIPDSRVLQEVTYPKVEQLGKEYRTFPRGLDIFAVLRSARAAHLLDNLYKEARFPNYAEQRAKMMNEFANTPVTTWQSNLYWGWLFTLRPLLEVKGAGYPSFMRNTAWLDKQLVTSLASWTELRHDTILYGKQSASECGDGEEPPPPPKGYVEPEPEVYARLVWLTKVTRQGLKSRKVLSMDLDSQFADFERLLTFLLNCSLKELRNEELSKGDNETIKTYGAALERLTLAMVKSSGESGPSYWDELTSTADKDMALVADVHTSGAEVLEEGVGRATELWVVIPAQGKLWLARGASFSYYEFRHPSADRLTDEKWQQMLNRNKQPAMPSWTSSYIKGKGKAKPTPRSEMQLSSTGC